MFILGERDQMTRPAAAQPLIDACARSRTLVLRGTGHALMAENPDGVRVALASFAQQVFAGIAA